MVSEKSLRIVPQVTGHAHFVEFGETLRVAVESPFDTIVITVHHQLGKAAPLDAEGLLQASAARALLPLDERFLRGRGCALPLMAAHGEVPAPGKVNSQGILELEASW